MNTLHVGRGTNRGALTVFPIWGEAAQTRGYTTRIENAAVAEAPGGPEVGTLTVSNGGESPLLILEGQILEGGWQNRMLARSVLIAARAELAVDVVCVEAGRWGSGGSAHRSSGRRGSTRVRSALRTPDRQSEVWRRVSEFDGRVGANDTSSFTEHAERSAVRVEDLVDGLRPFPGQVGVLIGLGGQPIAAEVFDSTATLRRQFDSIVRAAAMDALWLEPIPTPSRRARRFLDRASHLEARPVAQAGLGTQLRAESHYAEANTLLWQDRAVHTVLTNPRHELVTA